MARSRLKRISTELPEITAVHGDGTDRRLLEEEVGTYDLFCALTHDDEVNLMAALLAGRIGAGRRRAERPPS